MNVLSLFDGMSCGQIALNRCGIKYDNYYASEIDKYAIKVTQANYPNTIQLGDVRNVHATDLPKIDLLIGGSPCQGFSFAGKQLNFEDERSKLFFEYVRLWKELQPRYWLLENVKMKKEYENVISGILGCKPIRLNSALVSAQNRERLYWTNIPVDSVPVDKGIVLKDIIESGEVDREKIYCIDANYWEGTNEEQYKKKARRQIVYNNPIILGNIYKSGGQNGQVFSIEGKSKTLSAGQGISGNGIGSSNAPKILDNEFIRKLTPIECERLQTVPDNFTNHVSSTQRYKMLGNGFTVDIIAFIFSFIVNPATAL